MPHILIVDDSLLTRRHLARTLSEVGYQTTQASDGDEALSILEDTPFDCVLLDMLMPHMSGHEVLARLRERGTHPPVIVLTADIQDTTREACLVEGALRILNKPPDKEELLSTVRAAVDQANT